MKIPNKLIIAAGIILVILILLTVFLTNLYRSKQQARSINQNGQIGLFESGKFTKELEERLKLTPTLSPKQIQQLNSTIKNFTPEQSENFLGLLELLPYETADFEIGYSELTGKLYVRNKTAKGEAELKKFLEENGLLGLFEKFGNLFEFTDKSIEQAINEAENDFIIRQQKETENKIDFFERFMDSNNINHNGRGETNTDLTSLVELFKTLVSFDAVEELAEQQGTAQTGQEVSEQSGGDSQTETSSTESSGTGEDTSEGQDSSQNTIKTNLYGACEGLKKIPCEDKGFCKWFFCGVGGGNGRCARKIADQEVLCKKPPPPLKDDEEIPTGALTLTGIFDEAGNKVGAPPIILRTVMQVECGWIFNFTTAKIADASKPGGGLQPGDPCYGANSAGAIGPMQFLASTWPPYSTAVNRYGGYSHTPNIRNIRDSTYAAAEKLRKDSLAFSINWKYEHVRRAIICYNAGCSRLDNPPASTIEYFNRVWAAYNGSN